MKSDELLTLIPQLTVPQKERVTRIVLDLVKRNIALSDSRPNTCPHCHKQTEMIKKGFHRGKQRYLCKECKHKFVYDSKTITSQMKISNDEFLEICMDTINLVPIEQTAARLNRSIPCIFNNRHKFLSFLEEALEDEMSVLCGTVEADGTYILESQKGSKNISRKARHRGEPASKRGLSSEQICSVTMTDRNGHEVFKTLCRAKPTSDMITSNFKDHICHKSILYVDGISTYDDLARQTDCGIRYLEGHGSYNEVEHLNTVNSIHSFIKETISYYRGVATKYMNRYMALFVLIRRFIGMDNNEKEEILVDMLKNRHCTITRNSLSEMHLCDI